MKNRYFVAKFGYQFTTPRKDPIESGRYVPRDDWANYENLREGDFILLYCTGSYSGYDREVPALGVILRVQPPAINYSYLPLEKSITLDNLRNKFVTEDKAKLDNLRFDSFNVFEISPESFKQAITGHSINWSGL